MPWSEDQKITARIAEHAPESLFRRNKSMLSMSREELHKLATGKIKKKKRKSVLS